MKIVTLSRDARPIRELDLQDGPVYIGRREAILKRKLNAYDVCIPRCAARLEVDSEHAGTVLLTNTHAKMELRLTLPDESTCIVRAQEEMAIPSGVVLWSDVKLTYDLSRPSIYSQDTDDGDVTADDEEETFDGGEAQPRDTQGSSPAL